MESINNLSREEWQKFCEVMLRQHYGQDKFWPVPDIKGDYGIEFYTANSTIFQCYRPDTGLQLPNYIRKIQNKINTDLNKLKLYEKDISGMLDGIKINQWVLMTPENRTKDLIAYCHKKKRELIKKILISLIKTISL